MRVALVDHYDSFTFNVIDWLTGLDSAVTVDYLTFDDPAGIARLRGNPCPLVVSPGPKRPEDAGATLALVKDWLGKVPILGICLGHQILAVATGGQVVRAKDPHHGATRRLHMSDAPGLLAGLASGVEVASYNSLVVAPGTLAPNWQINAVCGHGEIQAMSRIVQGEAPAFGLQFHPESFLSEGAAQMRLNWLSAMGMGQHSAIAPLAMPS
ncbi:MAG: aminodeoxychorismate/anthranilate synthase component II [Deltaproteobacteria bacterium]|nr:aminodeoxychorismate/anthranilate synthase component II [Deltaproteobacteria bacterium]